MPDPRPNPNRSPYPSSVAPVEIWIGEKRAFLQYTIETVQRLKRRLGHAMFGVTGGILQMDEDMLPVLLEEGIVNEDGSRMGEYVDEEGGGQKFVPTITAAEISKLPVVAYKFLQEDFNHAWNGAMPDKKKARLEAIARLEAAENLTS